MVTEIQSALTSFEATNWVPGSAIAAVVPDGSGRYTTHELFSGYADIATATVTTATTQFEIGSVTKLFTAALLEKEVQAGALHLSDDLNDGKYLPKGVTAPSSGGQQITLGELATHTSGLPTEPASFWTSGSTTPPHYDEADLWSDLANTTLLFTPGTSWAYSDFGYGLLGTVLADFEGSSYGSLVTAQIAAPLGMSETELEPLSAPADLAQGYDGTAADPQPGTPRDNIGAMAGNGGLISSLSDMETFVAVSLGYGSSALRSTFQATEQQASPLGPDPSTSMGLGWQIVNDTGAYPVTFLEKNGSTHYQHSATCIVPSRGVGAVVLTNGPNDVTDLCRGVLRAVSP